MSYKVGVSHGDLPAALKTLCAVDLWIVSFVVIGLYAFYSLTRGKLLYSVALVSAVQRCESVLIIYVYPLPLELPSPPPQPLGHQSVRLVSVCFTATSHQLSTLHMMVCVCQCYFLSLFHPLLPLLCPQVSSLYFECPCEFDPAFRADSSCPPCSVLSRVLSLEPHDTSKALHWGLSILNAQLLHL